MWHSIYDYVIGCKIEVGCGNYVVAKGKTIGFVLNNGEGGDNNQTENIDDLKLESDVYVTVLASEDGKAKCKYTLGRQDSSEGTTPENPEGTTPENPEDAEDTDEEQTPETYGICGTMNSWGKAGADLAMSAHKAN